MDKHGWNTLVKKHAPPFGAFLEAWEWGEFQEALGRRVERVHERKNGKEMLAQAIEMDLPAGLNYWYTPKGPLGSMDVSTRIDVLRRRTSDGVFFRIEPESASRMLAVKDMQPSTTLVLDLAKSEEDLLAGMKSKTRYNIRLSGRKGVVSSFRGLSAFDDFVRLLEQTTKRDRFSAHPSSYYHAMLEALSGGEVNARLAVAEFDGRVLAVNIVIDFAGSRVYLHGATSNLHRNVMAQYNLHWFLIRDAKKRGMKIFDFWGIAPEGAGKGHPWYGISRYKKGYGGEVLTMPGTFELPIKHIWYSMYRAVKAVRR